MRLLKVTLLTGLLVTMAWPQTIGDNTDIGVIAQWERADVNGIDVFDHRGLIAGQDVDGDNIPEIWVSIYTGGGGVAGFEMIDDSTLECIYADTTGSITGGAYSATRWVQIGDLDHDGLKEVIYFAGRDVSDTTAGLYIVETTGNNTFADPVFFGYNSLGFTFNGMNHLTSVLVEHFLVDDVDGDGVDELIFASNRYSWITDFIDTVIVGIDTTYDTYEHSEDFFGVLSATDDLQGAFPGTIVVEFATSARDIDMGSVMDTASALFGRDYRLGSGSAMNVVIADTDGDGLKEIVCHAWSNFNTFIVEATAANTYSFGDTTNVNYYSSDYVCLKHGTAYDIDGDNRDEVFLPVYNTGAVVMLDDADGESTTLTASEMSTILADTAFYVTAADDTISLNAQWGAAAGDIDQDGNPDIYVGASTAYGYDIVDMEFDGTNWTFYALNTDSLANVRGIHPEDIFDPPLAMGIAVADLDGDGYDELITGYQGTMGDSVLVIDTVGTPDDTTIVVHPRPWWSIRVSEWAADRVVSSRVMRLITPEDFKLAAAYPNPFNPTTNIEYTLPLAKEVSLIVYNLRGQEVVRLVDHELNTPGTHQVRWNGLDARGAEVASGMYIYVLKWDSFSKSKRVTFLK